MSFLDQYKAWLKNGGLANTTINKYVWALNKYEREQGSILEINQERLNAFLAESNTSIRRSMLRSVAEFRPVPFRKVTFKKFKQPPRKLPRALKAYEFNELMNKVAEPYRTVIWLMGECGLRISEAINLQVQDIDTLEGVVRVTGKGNKERIVYPSPALLNRLRGFSERLGLSGYLFPSPIHEGRPIHTNTVRVHIKKVLEHAHPHMLRHYFATKVYSTSEDLRVTQDLLGHSNIATTSIYARVTNKKAAEAAQEAWKQNN